MKKLDFSLEAIKGFSCILMILAHTPLDFSGGERPVQIMGGLAPVLFFAVSGVTATFQSRKNLLPFVGYYLCFALLGLSYNAIWKPEIWSDLASDVPQIIAMCVFVIFLCEKYLKPKPYVYLLITVSAYLLHLLLAERLPDFPLRQFFVYEGYFTLFPWLFTFSAGIFAYRSGRRSNLLMAIASTVLLLAYYVADPPGEFLVKYDMSAGYFLLSLALIFWSFYLFRLKQNYNPAGPLIYLGNHSFLFLYVHLLFINILIRLNMYQVNIVLIWIAVLLLTYFSLKIILLLNQRIDFVFNYAAVWLILGLLTVSLPLVTDNVTLILFAEIMLGIAYSCNYKKLSGIIFNKLPSFAKKDLNL